MASSPTSQEFNLWTEREHAEIYLKSRPPYQNVAIPWLIDYYHRKNSTERSKKIPLAIDVACGNGQLTRKLAEYCDRVIGIDISPAMIESARQHSHLPNVEYRLGSERDLRKLCAGEKANIVTVGLAINFFNCTLFYSEIGEILMDGGVLGIFGYRTPGFQITGFETYLDDFIHDQYSEVKNRTAWLTLLRYYSNINVPFEGEERRVLPMNVEVDRDQIRAWFLSQPKDSKDGNEGIEKAMEKLPPQKSFDMICDVIGIMAQK